MKQYKNIIFDLDGTLVDTSEGIYNSIRYTQQQMNLSPITQEQMRSHIGPPMHDSYSRNFGLSGEQLDKAIFYHKDYALKKGLYEVAIYNGIPDLLRLLNEKGYNLSVATLKFEETAKKMLHYLDIAQYFDVICGVLPDVKPTKAQLLEKCIIFGDGHKENTLLIGDSCYDAQGAEIANVDFLGVTYGFGFETKNDVDKYKNVAWADSVQTLSKIFNK